MTWSIFKIGNPNQSTFICDGHPGARGVIRSKFMGKICLKYSIQVEGPSSPSWFFPGWTSVTPKSHPHGCDAWSPWRGVRKAQEWQEGRVNSSTSSCPPPKQRGEGISLYKPYIIVSPKTMNSMCFFLEKTIFFRIVDVCSQQFGKTLIYRGSVCRCRLDILVFFFEIWYRYLVIPTDLLRF